MYVPGIQGEREGAVQRLYMPHPWIPPWMSLTDTGTIWQTFHSPYQFLIVVSRSDRYRIDQREVHLKCTELSCGRWMEDS